MLTAIIHCMILTHCPISLPLLPSCKTMSARSNILASVIYNCIFDNIATRWLLNATLRSTITSYSTISPHFIIDRNHDVYEMLHLRPHGEFIDICQYDGPSARHYCSPYIMSSQAGGMTALSPSRMTVSLRYCISAQAPA